MVHAATVALSAFLLFLVQPMAAKHLLPWFGGTPAVWATCSVFFQTVLLLGYAYAHAVATRLGRQVQARVHGLVLALSLAAIGVSWLAWGAPLLPPASWQPADQNSVVPRILARLAVGLGVPFFALSTTTPLLQRWYSLTPSAPAPYRLYALSNAGSMLGLLCYPFAVEPLAGLPRQATAWAAGFALFTCGSLACAAHFGRSRPSIGPGNSTAVSCPARPPAWDVRVSWAMLAACTSAMTLAVTNQLCLEVAVVPFLWVLPLAIFLATFILCFDRPDGCGRRASLLACAVLTAIVLWTAQRGLKLFLAPQLAAYSLFLFGFCMAFHGELYRLRPDPSHLTAFYLMVGVGGAAGGALVAWVPPVFCSGIWEFHFVVVAGWLILMSVLCRDRASPWHTGHVAFARLVLVAVAWGAVRLACGLLRGRRGSFLALHRPELELALMASAGLLVWVWTRRAVWARSSAWPRLAMAMVLFAAQGALIREVQTANESALAVARNFYGLLRIGRYRIRETGEEYVALTHGRINHGFQYAAPELRSQPASYFVPGSGVGAAFGCHARRTGRDPGGGLRIGVAGLGAGALAAYAERGDSIRFYEINPAVVRYAFGPQALFSYLNDCAGEVSVQLGDARLSLERELRDTGSMGFDILTLDAFSSDAVPVHLLTREAFRVYAAHLRDGHSVIAVNVSNRFLELERVVFAAAADLGLEARLFSYRGDLPRRAPSRWILLTRDRAFFAQAAVRARRPTGPTRRLILWTDAHTDLFRVVRRRR